MNLTGERQSSKDLEVRGEFETLLNNVSNNEAVFDKIWKYSEDNVYRSKIIAKCLIQKIQVFFKFLIICLARKRTYKKIVVVLCF